MRFENGTLLAPLIADSRLKGYFIRRDDVASLGLQQTFCSNCGRPVGAARFDDPNSGETMVEVICNACIEKFGKPPIPGKET